MAHSPNDSRDTQQLAGKLLADFDLALTLLNLEMKWLQAERAIPLETLAQAAEQRRQVLQLKAEFEAHLAAQAAVSCGSTAAETLIRFPDSDDG